jgi:hypothetical protein
LVAFRTDAILDFCRPEQILGCCLSMGYHSILNSQSLLIIVKRFHEVQLVCILLFVIHPAAANCFAAAQGANDLVDYKER